MKRQKITNKIPQTRASKCFDVGVWVILLFIFFCTAYPFYYVIIASFSNGCGYAGALSWKTDARRQGRS